MSLAVIIGSAVFRLEVEDVNWKNYTVKEVVLLRLEMRLQMTVVVIKYDIRNILRTRINRLDKIL